MSPLNFWVIQIRSGSVLLGGLRSLRVLLVISISASNLCCAVFKISWMIGQTFGEQSGCMSLI